MTAMTVVRHFTVATAGHVDHGKSSLVRALTGTDPDRLPEEKTRGITIELGFAQLQLTDESGAGADYNLGMVDVPGHEDFIKNMVAGVGAVDLALLIVAADDGWMPQTEEHLQILEYLGVTRCVVALTKIDRVGAEWEPQAIAAVRRRLRDSAFADAAIVPTSVATGRGLDALREAIRAALASATPRPELRRPRLWIDRAFTLNGIGTIVTGTLTGGAVSVGDTLDVSGKGASVRVRSVHNHGSSCTAATPGMRTALNVVGVGGAAVAVERGDLLTTPKLAKPRRCYDVELARCARPCLGPHDSEIVHNTVLRLYVGTTAAPCRVVLGDEGRLTRGERKIAQLRLAAPLALVAGEAFVLRDAKGRATVAGGVVLHGASDSRMFRIPAHQQMLAELTTALQVPERYVSVRVRGQSFVRETELVADAPFSENDVAGAIAARVRAGECVAVAGVIAVPGVWNALRSRAEALVTAHHRSHPTQNGIPLANLRSALRDRATPRFVIEALIAELESNSCERVGAAIRVRGFRPHAPAGLEAAAARMAAVLRQTGLNPPNRNELARTPVDRDALEFLLKTGKAIALAPETIVSAGVYGAAREKVRTFLITHQRATVSELRQALGSSRRIMVPLLEKLDADGVTKRDGEYRRLSPSPVQPVECPSASA